ncbi:MAG: triose-phosphate isomerase [Candidatus Kaiserbacteria bacterium]|nr:triose-phosphate isomerase [Candidatus Kaiserbacteria bacterium]
MKSLIVANWKMNPATYAEAKALFDATKKHLEKTRSISLIVAPPAIFLRELSKGYKGKRIAFAVQSANAEKGGAFTGEISLEQAYDSNADYALVAHAERRAAGETNEDARKKVIGALDLRMTPVLCIGETSRDEGGSHFTHVKEQLRIALSDVPAQKITKVVVAYEPVWAIGATKPMNGRDMHEMAIFIRKSIVATHGQEGLGVKILYGGSIDETNAVEMLQTGDVDGLLVGRASSDARKFGLLISAIADA